MLLGSFQGGVPLDAWQKGDDNGDDAQKWVWFSPAGVAREGCAVSVKTVLIQEGGEVFIGRYDLAVCRDRRYIIRHEQML